MSLIEEQNKAHNLQAIEDRKMAEKEHAIELERQRRVEESYKNPTLLAFRARRDRQVQNLRSRKVLL